MTNPARDLAATGTPAPWRTASWIIGGLLAVGPDEQVTAYDMTEPNATKVVRAVNALPAIADLLDALDVEPDSDIDHERAIADWWAAVDDARDRVAAALTGDAS